MRAVALGPQGIHTDRSALRRPPSLRNNDGSLDQPERSFLSAVRGRADVKDKDE